MVEPEVAYNDLDDNMDLAEDFIKYIVGQVLKNRAADLKTLERDTSKLQATVEKKFPRIDYTDAIEILHKKATTPPGAETSAATKKPCWAKITTRRL